MRHSCTTNTSTPHSYSKSIIHDEKQYQIAENVFGAGYKGGENTRFYQEKGELLDDIHAVPIKVDLQNPVHPSYA